MTDGISVDMSGADVLIASLGELDIETRIAVNMALYRFAKATFDEAEATVPVDTGELHDSEYLEVGDLKAEVGFDSDHAVYVELGTYKMAAQPYLLPAFEHNLPTLIDALSHLDV